MDDIEIPGVRISLQMIMKRHLPTDAGTWTQEKILAALGELTHVRLDRENIANMDLELLGDSVTNLYLQNNQISRIENLEYIKNLQFLTLSSNKLRHIEGISHLQKLVFFDVSYNFIHSLDADELPKSISILNLKGNKCSELPDHKQRMLIALPRLRQLDEVELTNNDRRTAGLDWSSSEEEESGEEDEEENNERFEFPEDALDAMLKSKSVGMLLRSQDRQDDYTVEHQNKLLYLSDLREQTYRDIEQQKQSSRKQNMAE